MLGSNAESVGRIHGGVRMTEVARTTDGFNYAALDPDIAGKLRQQSACVRDALKTET